MSAVRKPSLLLAAIAAAAACIGCAGGDDDAPASAEAPKRPFTVTSTLDGKKVLPHRIRWVAFPKPKGARVKKVEFLIDGGKPRWVEEEAPYTFGEDENGKHKGYLVTSWLTPGNTALSSARPRPTGKGRQTRWSLECAPPPRRRPA